MAGVVLAIELHSAVRRRRVARAHVRVDRALQRHLKGAQGPNSAIVGRKSGPTEGYLWQYEVQSGPSLRLARKFGRFSGNCEIEAIVADDVSGYVYYSDEGAGIRKYAANPDGPDAAKELALFGRSGYQGDREGLAIYSTVKDPGYLISTDQIPGGSRYLLYALDGFRGNPHDHRLMCVIQGWRGRDGWDRGYVHPAGSGFPTWDAGDHE